MVRKQTEYLVLWGLILVVFYSAEYGFAVPVCWGKGCEMQGLCGEGWHVHVNALSYTLWSCESKGERRQAYGYDLMACGGVTHRSKGCALKLCRQRRSCSIFLRYKNSPTRNSTPTAFVSQAPGGDGGQASCTNRHPGTLLLTCSFTTFELHGGYNFVPLAGSKGRAQDNWSLH